MADPLWKIESGRFAGWRQGNFLYNVDGECVGFFMGAIAFSLDGDYLGEVLDGDWIGKQESASYAPRMGRVPTLGIEATPQADRFSHARHGWQDPSF